MTEFSKGSYSMNVFLATDDFYHLDDAANEDPIDFGQTVFNLRLPVLLNYET